MENEDKIMKYGGGVLPLELEQSQRFVIDGVELSKQLTTLMGSQIEVEKTDLLKVKKAELMNSVERRKIETELSYYNQRAMNFHSRMISEQSYIKSHFGRIIDSKKAWINKKDEFVESCRQSIEYYQRRLASLDQYLFSKVWNYKARKEYIAKVENFKVVKDEAISRHPEISLKVLDLELDKEKKVQEILEKYQDEILKEKTKLFEKIDSIKNVKLKPDEDAMISIPGSADVMLKIDYYSWALSEVGEEYKKVNGDMLERIEKFSTEVMDRMGNFGD